MDAMNVLSGESVEYGSDNDRPKDLLSSIDPCPTMVDEKTSH